MPHPQPDTDVRSACFSDWDTFAAVEARGGAAGGAAQATAAEVAEAQTRASQQAAAEQARVAEEA